MSIRATMTMTTPMTMTMMPATILTAITIVSVHQYSSTILYTCYKHRNCVNRCFTVLKLF